MLIATGNLSKGSLSGQVAVITGAGSGIGFETARALLWLGARVIIAEIDKTKGKQAEARLAEEIGNGQAAFVQTDVGDEGSVQHLMRQCERLFDNVDIVINNATIAPLGAVLDVPVRTWDDSYRVNLRGPVLLARLFLPGMLKRNSGVFVCVSSTGMEYMGAYESIKAAQVHLANTLAAELEGSSVCVFTIGPGYVPTQTAASALPNLAGMMGIDVKELKATLSAHTLSIEAAGAGFAAAVALAEQFRGQETSSTAALIAAGIDFPAQAASVPGWQLTPEGLSAILALCKKVRQTLAEQAAGWKERSLFEQQWMLRSFKKYAGFPVEQWLEILARLEGCAGTGEGLADVHAPLDRLASFYDHLGELAKGYIKDPAQREENLAIVAGWRDDALQLFRLLGNNS